MSNQYSECARCIMPASFPGNAVDDNGICSICHDFDHKWGTWFQNPKERDQAESRLSHIMAQVKSLGRKYDCIVPTSGGRDSLYILHICTVKYGLNPLVFTVDNGFWAENSRKNLNVMVQKLGLKHIVVKPDGMMDLYRLFAQETRDCCAPCNYFIFHLTAEAAYEYRVPLVVMGGCTRLDMVLPIAPIAPDPWLFRNVVRKNSQNSSLMPYGQMPWRFFLYYAKGGKRLQPFDYLDWSFEERENTLEQTYGITIEKEHADCEAHDLFAFLSSKHSRLRKYGFSYETMKYSQLIRNGLMNREEALRQIEQEQSNELPESLDSSLQKLGLTRSEFSELLELPPNTDRYTGVMSKLTNWWRKYRFQRGSVDQERFFPDL